MPHSQRVPARFRYTAQDIEDGIKALYEAHRKLGVPMAYPLTPPYHAATHAPKSLSPNTESGYCLACHAPKEFQVEKDEQFKTGSRRRAGTCPDCGGAISVFRAAPEGKGANPSKG